MTPAEDTRGPIAEQVERAAIPASEGSEAGLKARLYFVVLTGSGDGVAHGVALKFASFGSRRNDVLV